MKIRLLAVLLFLILVFNSNAQDGKSYTKDPVKLTEFATDQTATLRPKEYIKLKNRLQRFYDSTSTQIVFLMINSLNGESIEEVANSIFRFNQIGTKDKNNGVLFMIAKKDRKIRIEVGYGLEGVLTDAACKMIIKNHITPDLKNDNYNDGINKGIDAIQEIVRGEFTSEKLSAEKLSEPVLIKPEKSIWESAAFVVVLVLAFILIPVLVVIFLVAKGKIGKGGGSGYSESSHSSSNSSSSSSYNSSSSSSDSGFSGGGGDSGGGGASGDY